MMTNQDRQSLLADAERLESPSSRFTASNNFKSKWKKNLPLLLLSLFIATCLTIYLYLNLVAIDGSNQPDSPNRYKPLSRRKPMLDHESIFSDSGPSMLKLSDLLAHCIVALQVAGQEVVKISLLKNHQLHQVGSKGRTLEGADDVVTGADLKSHRMILNTIKDSYRRLDIVSEEDTTKAFENIRLEDDILPIDRIEFARLLRNNLIDIEGQHANRGSLIAQHETLVWVDPLDATKEYSENLTNYVTLMACIVHKSQPIAGVIHKPFTNLTFWSFKDEPTGKYHHSPDLTRVLQKAVGKEFDNDRMRVMISRSHAGDIENVLRRLWGDQAQVIPAGGSGYKTIELINQTANVYMHTTHIKKWDICAPHAILNSLPAGRMTDLKGGTINFGNPKDKIVTSGIIASLDAKIHKDVVDLMKNSQ